MTQGIPEAEQVRKCYLKFMRGVEWGPDRFGEMVVHEEVWSVMRQIKPEKILNTGPVSPGSWGAVQRF